MNASQEEKADFDKTKILECIRRLEGLKNEHNLNIRKLRWSLSNQSISNDEYQNKIQILNNSLTQVDQALNDARVIYNKKSQS